jgi:hypothetical protein
MSQGKKICSEKAQLFLAEISDIRGNSILLKDFLRDNMEMLLKSNATVKEIHEMFKKHGIEVGSYGSFSAYFKSAKNKYLMTLQIDEKQKDQQEG